MFIFSSYRAMYVYIYMSICICIHLHIHIHVHVHVHVQIHNAYMCVYAYLPNYACANILTCRYVHSLGHLGSTSWAPTANPQHTSQICSLPDLDSENNSLQQHQDLRKSVTKTKHPWLYDRALRNQPESLALISFCFDMKFLVYHFCGSTEGTTTGRRFQVTTKRLRCCLQSRCF